ncbi:MAG: hypothetical protein LIO58_09345 [Oscillospiraceae bacterium]|nr:hypothetical protein [Oscillospiraceae bacterium]
MRRVRAERVSTTAVDGVMPGLAVLSFCFLAGGLIGVIVAAKAGGDGGASLSAYLTGFMQAAGDGEMKSPPILSSLWELFRWPLLGCLLGFTAIGLIGIPVLFAARGFYLAFSIACFVRVFGQTGDLIAFLMFGITGLISVPVLFVLGTQSLHASMALAGRMVRSERGAVHYDKAYWMRCIFCVFALCVCFLLEYLAVPAMLAGAAGTLT